MANLQKLKGIHTLRQAWPMINQNFDNLNAELADQDARINNIVADAGSSNTEIVDARYSSEFDMAFPVLKDRLDAIEKRSREAFLSVKDFGAKGDGVTDDTIAVQNALNTLPNGGKLVFPTGIYAVQNIVLANKENVIIDGQGSTLKLISTGARIGFQLSGTVKNAEIKNFKIEGTKSISDQHAGIYCASGAFLTNIKVLNNEIRNVTLGISFSADFGGSINGLLIEGNHLESIVGTESGYGYGIHHASSDLTTSQNVRIIANTIISAQRHSIYQAKGRGIVIANNTILNHRDANANNDVRAAVVIGRSVDVTCIGNSIIKPAGGGIAVGGPGPNGTDSKNILVYGNMLTDPQDAAQLIFIGQQDPTTEGIPTGVNIVGNFLWSAGKSLMMVWNGKSLNISDNHFIATGENPGGMTALQFSGLGNTTNEYLDNVLVQNNVFDLDSGSGAEVAIRFSPGQEAATTRYWFVANRFIKGLSEFASSSVITNPNITVIAQTRNGMSFAAGAYPSPALYVEPILGTSGGRIGFYGASPVTKPTVTGAKGGNAALASLLTALQSLGLITDSTSS